MHPSMWMCPGPTEQQPVGASCLPLGQTTAAPEHLRSGHRASAWTPRHVSPGRPCHLLLKPPRFTPDSQGDPPACALAGSLTQDPQEGTSGRKVQGPLRGRAWDTGFKCAGQAASLQPGEHPEPLLVLSLLPATRIPRPASRIPQPTSRIPQPASQGEGARSGT